MAQSTVCHGPIGCRRCWSPDSEVQERGDFRLVHDPGHWGASDPTTLILGISKGNTQSHAFAKEPFEQVAFKGIRSRILEILRSVNLLADESPLQFERRFGSDESDFAFASVVRCLLTGMNRKKGVHTAESPCVLPAFRSGSEAFSFVANCVDQHLTNLSLRTKLVLLLGNTGSYISALREIISIKRGRVVPINAVGYWAADVKFVHLAHPSRGNGHFGAFVRGEGTPGQKRDLAAAALRA